MVRRSLVVHRSIGEDETVTGMVFVSRDHARRVRKWALKKRTKLENNNAGTNDNPFRCPITIP
jgi:hypothetical protein